MMGNNINIKLIFSSFALSVFIIQWAQCFIASNDDIANKRNLLCDMIGWRYALGPDVECPPGTVELFRDVKVGLPLENRFCCHTESPYYADFKEAAAQRCRATSCQASSSSSSDICSTLDPRYINNGRTKLGDYRVFEVESCATPTGGGGEGVLALCCRRGSAEGENSARLRAEPNEFPHMAELVHFHQLTVEQREEGASSAITITSTGHRCGATVYNSRFILTAAHCLYDHNVEETMAIKNATKYRILVGSNIAGVQAEERTYGIKRFIPHPSYERRELGKRLMDDILECRQNDGITITGSFNDIALIELDREIIAGDFGALRIAHKGFEPLEYADHALFLGWGIAYHGDPTVYLRNENFPMEEGETCHRNHYSEYPSLSAFKEQHICVGGGLLKREQGNLLQYPGLDGHSGGPAICRGPHGKALLCGVASSMFDASLCLKYELCPPMLYTAVGHFQEWIEEVAGTQEVTSTATLYEPYLFGRPLQEREQHVHAHQVLILSGSDPLCGGTLLDSNVVLTPAHCVLEPGVVRKPLPDLKVVAGLHEIRGQASYLTCRAIRIHFNYETDQDDIAVITLTGHVASPQKFPKLPAATHHHHHHQQSLGGGGVLMAFRNNFTRSPKKEQRSFSFLTGEECQARYEFARIPDIFPGRWDKDSVICAVESYSGGSVYGGSVLGGGLICKDDDRNDDGEDVLCGLHIFPDFSNSMPSLFLNVAYYRGWIEESMRRLRDEL